MNILTNFNYLIYYQFLYAVAYIIIFFTMYILNSLYSYTTSTFIPNQQPRALTLNKQNKNIGYTNKFTLKSKPSLKLPKSFAQQVMELQMIIENGDLRYANDRLKHISRLNQLYMTGIQFYGKNKSNDCKNKRKMEHFTKKLTQLYMNQQVIRILQQSHNKKQQNIKQSQNIIPINSQHVKIKPYQSNDQNINTKIINSNPVLYLSNLKQQISKFTSQSDYVIKNIIQLTSKKQQTSLKKVQQSLENQQNILKHRLAERSRKREMSKIKKKNYQSLERTNFYKFQKQNNQNQIEIKQNAN